MSYDRTMEPGPIQIRGAIVRTVVVALWMAGCAGVFGHSMTHARAGTAAIALLVGILAGFLIDIAWFGPVIGMAGIGAVIGASWLMPWPVVVLGVGIGFIPIVVWGVRLARRLRLYRAGVAARGRVVVSDGPHGREDTHVTARDDRSPPVVTTISS
ncbi:hypothetical protein SAMN04488550_0435 [Gordonia malaquae]|uniref:Uncharacterized protein n=2 Tax=Gordonia malaquae TaxID=410332 RepID=M3UHR1_GORML|nr:hypothetical protein GM1_005_01080 [Gordonia malaquae NBRC 108250]SEB59344.1 hypothetical protein SAMN04488550_0435 [Gordonia malaquae]